ncbi:MAG: 23S rRNA pseudouridine(1911/1915/1917) synthase RluD [Pseudomonadota bacterium]
MTDNIIIEDGVNDFEYDGVLPDELTGLRIDAALAQLFPEHSRARLTEWLRNGQILVNGQSCLPKTKVVGGTPFSVRVVLQNLDHMVPQEMPLNIAYEDDEVLVINKDADVVVHPGAGNWEGTLLNGLLFHCPSLATLPRAGIVHRLDKGTTGLLVVAKTLTAHTFLVNHLQSRDMNREYVTLVYGLLRESGLVDAPIGRHPKERVKMAVVPSGKQAITHYQVLERFSDVTWLRVRLETGRTHQIRVHMAHLGFPLVGDQEYGRGLRLPRGSSLELRNTLAAFQRPALHAARLSFIHPVSKEWIQCDAPIPADLEGLLAAFRTEEATRT